MLRFLVNATLVMICLGIALAIAGWLAGATASGRKVRDAIAGAAHRWGSPLADGPVGRFTSDHPMFVPTLRAIVIALAAAYLILVDRRSPSMILWTFVIMAVALLLVEIIEGAGRGYEQPRAGALVAQADHASSQAVTEAPRWRSRQRPGRGRTRLRAAIRPSGPRPRPRPRRSSGPGARCRR